MPKGKFQATDDLDMAGHHIKDWRYLADIPRGGAELQDVLTWNGVQWAPASLPAAEAVVTTVLWEAVEGVPSEFPPEGHTHASTFSVNVMFSGNGATLVVTGSGGAFRLPTACTLISASIVADQSGTVVVALESTTYAGYTGSLTDITGGGNLGLSGAVSTNNMTITAWTTSYGAGDVVTYTLSGTPSSVTWACVTLTFEKTVS